MWLFFLIVFQQFRIAGLPRGGKPRSRSLPRRRARRAPEIVEHDTDRRCRCRRCKIQNGTIQKQDFFDDDRTIRSVLNLIWQTTPRSLVNQLLGILPAPTIHYAKKHLEGSQECYTRSSSPIPSSPGPRSPSPHRSSSKRSRPKSPSRSLPRGARRRVSFAEGEDDSLPPVCDE